VRFADGVPVAVAINKTAPEVNIATPIFVVFLLSYVILRKSLDGFVFT
jgi:hypothetical protein